MIGLVHRSPAWLCRLILYLCVRTAHAHILYNDSFDCQTGCLDSFTIWLECTPITRAGAPLVHCSSAACIAMQAALPRPCVHAAHIAALHIVPIACYTPSLDCSPTCGLVFLCLLLKLPRSWPWYICTSAYMLQHQCLRARLTLLNVCLILMMRICCDL